MGKTIFHGLFLLGCVTSLVFSVWALAQTGLWVYWLVGLGVALLGVGGSLYLDFTRDRDVLERAFGDVYDS